MDNVTDAMLGEWERKIAVRAASNSVTIEEDAKNKEDMEDKKKMMMTMRKKMKKRMTSLKERKKERKKEREAKKIKKDLEKLAYSKNVKYCLDHNDNRRI